MCNVPRSLTPERFHSSCRLRRMKCCFLPQLRYQPSRFTNIMKLNPFNHVAFGPPPNCLRLKTKVTFSPPKLATSEWLVLILDGNPTRYMIRPRLGRTTASLVQ